MSQSVFLVALAMLTALSGLALLWMLIQRRHLREERHGERPRDERPASESRAGDVELRELEDLDDADLHDEGGERPRRLIDDYAIPTAFDDAADLRDEEPDVGKICPRCGARYGSHHRFCERDNSELAALN